MTLQICVFKGQEISPHVPTLADMRLKAFFEFPYLYSGSKDDELSYAQRYVSSPQGLLLGAFKNSKIVGLISGIPLDDPHCPLKPWNEKFQDHGLKTKSMYYMGEVIVAPEFQKKPCFSLLFSRFLKEVRSLGFSKILGITCARSPHHPLCPPNYQGIEKLLKKLSAENLNIFLSDTWKTRQYDGTFKTQENTLMSWCKTIEY